ncbi:MAG TPA: PAS domain S-box protein, partial [Ktedonobacterales bacterium]
MTSTRRSTRAAPPTHAANAADAGIHAIKPSSAIVRRPLAARSASAGRFAALAQATGQLVWISQPDGTVVDAPLWRAFTGQTATQAAGWGWLDALHPHERQLTGRLLREAVARQQPFELDYQVRGSDGVYRAFVVRTAPVLGANGSLREWVSAASDISERQRLDAKLAEADRERAALREHERALLESSADGFFVVDTAGTLTYINASLEWMLGRRREELVGHDVGTLFPETLTAPFAREYERAKALSTSAMFDLFYPPMGLWFEARLYASPDGITGRLSASAARRQGPERQAPQLTREQELQADHVDHIEATQSHDEAEAARRQAEMTSHRLRHLQEVTDAALGHLALDDLVPAVLDHICAVMAVDSAAILLLAEDGHDLAVHAARGALENKQIRIPVGQGLAGRIMASQKPLLVDDLAEAEVISPVLRDQLRSVAGVPLHVEGRRLGVLLVGAARPRQFAASDAQLLQSVGVRIALAIDHARLYELAQVSYTEAEARASELAATIGAMTDGVFVTDKEGNTVRSNQAFRHLLGIDLLPTPTSIPAHARGSLMDVRDAQGQPVPPDQMPTARILRGEALQGSSAQDVTLRALDGRIVEANVTGAPVRTTDGGIVGAVAVYRDVTKRRQLERQVTEQASQLEGIFETMADGLVVFDAYGRILRENAADFAMFGFDRAEAGSPRTLIERGQLLGLRDEHGRMLPHMQWPTFRVLRGEELHGNEAVELKAHTADGRELQISESAAPIRDKAGHIVGGVLVIRDVTARRKLENQTRDALQSLLGMAEALVSPENAVGASTPYEASLVMRRLAELTRSLLGCQRVSFTTLDEEMERIRPILRVGAPLKQEPCGDAHKEGFHRSDYLPTALIERLRAGEVVAHDVDVAAASAHAGAGQAARRVLFAPMRINWRLIGLLR